MAGKIFGDEDLTVRMQRTRQGLGIELTCRNCDGRMRVLHPWSEVRLMLDGFEVPGVQPTDEGWVVATECTDCQGSNKYQLSDDEVEDAAEREVARRQRHAQQGRR
jgi:RNase P subunit RPR2